DFEGYHVVTARRGEDAVTALGSKSRGNLAAIVIDYNFGGGMNGIDAVKAVRNAVRRHVPAIVLTGDRSAETIATIEKGGAHYLAKPVKAQILLDFVETMTRAAFPEWEKSESMPVPISVGTA